MHSHHGVEFSLGGLELHRDAELEKSLIDAGRQFWNDHVLTKVPPKIDGTLSWSHYLGRRFALEKKPAIEATEEIASWAIVLLRAVVLYIEVAQQPSAEAS